MVMIEFKEGVVLRKWTEPIDWMIACLKKVDGTPGFPKTLVVTSINDGEHSVKPPSRHYTDEAIDVRSHDFETIELKTEFINTYRRHLNSFPAKRLNAFFLILEDQGTPNEHFHIQVNKGQTYP